MYNLILAILCSVAVSVLLKVARKKNIIIEQAIAFNYIVAISLSYFLLKPDFKGLEFTEYLAQSDSTPIFLALGILLPTVFIIMSKAIEFAYRAFRCSTTLIVISTDCCLLYYLP